jgi:hypothetical protein
VDVQLLSGQKCESNIRRVGLHWRVGRRDDAFTGCGQVGVNLDGVPTVLLGLWWGALIGWVGAQLAARLPS